MTTYRMLAFWLSSLVVLSAVTALVAAPGDMQHPDRLSGAMFIAGARLVDPPPDEKSNTHAYLTLTGVAARRMYQSLDASAKADLCVPGRRSKTVGAVQCSVDGKGGDAQCAFALDLRTGAVVPGTVC